MFKISEEMAENNELEVGNPINIWIKIHCIGFALLLRGVCQLQDHIF